MGQAAIKSVIKVGVIVPMLSEAKIAFETLRFAKRETVGIWEVHKHSRRTASGTALTMGVLVSGIGMVNAAIAAQSLISGWDPDLVILLGCAGSIVEDILPGDVAIGTKLCSYSNFQTLRDGSVNLDMPGVRIRKDYRLAPDRAEFLIDEAVKTRFIDADPDLVGIALRAGRESAGIFRAWDATSSTAIHSRTPKCVPAIIGTADQINSDLEAIAAIRERYGVEVEECEGVAVAQVASTYGKPFLVIRGISDNEVVSPILESYSKGNIPGIELVETEATRNAWAVLLKTLDLLESLQSAGDK